MCDKSRGAIRPSLDLRVGAYGGDLPRAGHGQTFKGFGVVAGEGLLGEEAVDEHGDHLGFSIHTHDAPPFIGGEAQHEGTVGASVEGWGVACELVVRKSFSVDGEPCHRCWRTSAILPNQQCTKAV